MHLNENLADTRGIQQRHLFPFLLLTEAGGLRNRNTSTPSEKPCPGPWLQQTWIQLRPRRRASCTGAAATIQDCSFRSQREVFSTKFSAPPSPCLGVRRTIPGALRCAPSQGCRPTVPLSAPFVCTSTLASYCQVPDRNDAWNRWEAGRRPACRSEAWHSRGSLAWHLLPWCSGTRSWIAPRGPAQCPSLFGPCPVIARRTRSYSHPFGSSAPQWGTAPSLRMAIWPHPWASRSASARWMLQRLPQGWNRWTPPSGDSPTGLQRWLWRPQRVPRDTDPTTLQRLQQTPLETSPHRTTSAQPWCSTPSCSGSTQGLSQRTFGHNSRRFQKECTHLWYSRTPFRKRSWTLSSCCVSAITDSKNFVVEVRVGPELQDNIRIQLEEKLPASMVTGRRLLAQGCHQSLDALDGHNLQSSEKPLSAWRCRTYQHIISDWAERRSVSFPHGAGVETSDNRNMQIILSLSRVAWHAP